MIIKMLKKNKIGKCSFIDNGVSFRINQFFDVFKLVFKKWHQSKRPRQYFCYSSSNNVFDNQDNKFRLFHDDKVYIIDQ